MSNSEQILLVKLDQFIRRYYKNLLIRGAMYSMAIILLAFLTITIAEYYGHFSQPVRAVLFFGFVASASFVLARYLIFPLMKLYRIGSVISYDEAARIIGTHFSNVQDKLLNVLQLRSKRAMFASDELLLAGIDQKIAELRPVPFGSAVDFGQNRRYLRYLLPPLLFTLLIAAVWPHVFSRSTERLMNYDTFYEKELPFDFDIRNKTLTGVQSKDFILEVEATGSQVPDEAFIEIAGIEYKLEKLSTGNFKYAFTNLQENVQFRLTAGGYYSRGYEITVLPRPALQQFNVQLFFPSYLKRPPERLVNTGDLLIPEGTKVAWSFNTRNTSGMLVRFTDTTMVPAQSGADQFSFGRTFFRNNRYTLLPLNEFVRSGVDSVSYGVSVVPDRSPSIELIEKTDSLQPGALFFSGNIRDDYGFSSLSFHYRKLSRDSNGVEQELNGSAPIRFDRAAVSQPYFHFFDIASLGLGAGDRVEYYFEVYDNDGVKGPKSARTQMLAFRAPTKEELSAEADKNNEAITKDLEESIKKASSLQKEINELSRKINDKQKLGYEDKKSLQDLLKKQAELQKKIDDIRKQNEENSRMQNEFQPVDESILEKQKQLQELFENVMTPEMKKLFDELNRLLEKLDKNQVQEKLEELKLTNKDIEKELDRNLEAFRQLELQQKMQEAIDKLDELKQNQDELKKETSGERKDQPKDSKGEDTEKKNSEKEGGDSKEKSDQANLKERQEQLKKEFEELRKDLREMEQKNKALEEPLNLPSTEQKEQEIQQQMQNSQDQLQKGNNKKSSESQQNASDGMQEMKEQMEQAMESAEEQQQEENAAALRQILENLLHLSFAQEELMKDLKNTRIDNPAYVDIPKQQNKLRDDSRIIEDSLLALSKRAPQISAVVNREISSINMNMEKAVKHLADRNTSESSMRMQSTMKSVNDLAVMLNESLEQMQNQMKQKKNGKGEKGGKCKKPGSGSGQNPSQQGKPLSNMRQMQEQLNRQLQELKEALEKGQKPGEKPGDKSGQKPGNRMGSGLPSMPGSSEQFAKMAARQEALRRQMEELMQKMKNKGSQPGGNLADLMEQTERDLVNKQLTNETMRRQQDILTRLLESEKAEREREQDEQRKSTEAKTEIPGNPERFLEYKRLKEKEMELLMTVPPSLTPFYKEKVNNYFNQLNTK